jgi:hypothetical protein
MKTKQTIALVAAALLAGIPLAHAQKAPTGDSVTIKEPGKRVDVRTVEVSAAVQAVDKANRGVTLKGPGGKVQTLIVGPEVKNFDQIKVGDEVVVRYVEALAFQLVKAGTKPVARTEQAAGAAAKPGDKPAAAIGREVKVTANVTAVDAERQIVTLKGPQQSVEVKVQDPNQFKLVKVGDQVDVTYTEAVAVSVEPTASKDAPKKDAAKKEAPKKDAPKEPAKKP